MCVFPPHTCELLAPCWRGHFARWRARTSSGKPSSASCSSASERSQPPQAPQAPARRRESRAMLRLPTPSRPAESRSAEESAGATPRMRAQGPRGGPRRWSRVSQACCYRDRDQAQPRPQPRRQLRQPPWRRQCCRRRLRRRRRALTSRRLRRRRRPGWLPRLTPGRVTPRLRCAPSRRRSPRPPLPPLRRRLPPRRRVPRGTGGGCMRPISRRS